MQSMFKTGLYGSIDTEVSHDAADHHIFFTFGCQILQQTTLFSACTACSLDESFFSGRRLKLRIDLKLIVSDRKSSTRTIIVLNIKNFYNTSVDYLLGLTDEKRPYPRKKSNNL